MNVLINVVCRNSELSNVRGLELVGALAMGIVVCYVVLLRMDHR